MHMQDQRMILSHPLFNGSVFLPTKPAEELLIAVKTAVMCRETGFCAVSPAGVGKTSALIIVESAIKEIFPEIAVFRYDAHNHIIGTIRAFFMHFLHSVGHTNLRGETYQIRRRLVNALEDAARARGQNIVLLLVDEAHAMGVSDLKFLKDVYNDLARVNMSLITIMMAQAPDIGELLSELEEKRNLDLVGRFFIRIIQFSPLRTLENLSRILECVDELRHPEGGPTWTEFVFPQAVASGFKMATQAETFFRAMSPSQNLESFDFPARQAFLALRTFCLRNYGADCPNMVIDADKWHDAVARAHVVTALRLMEGTQATIDKIIT